MNVLVYGIVVDFNGSILVEYGIGCLKKVLFIEVKVDIEFDLMWWIKIVFDFKGLFNFDWVF